MKIIIANTNVGALLKASDLILKKYNSDGEVPEKIKGQATLAAIKHMTEGGHFNICAVREMAEMNEVEISSEHMTFFHTLHCVDWNKIHPDTKEYLMALMIDYFKGNIVMTNTEYGK